MKTRFLRDHIVDERIQFIEASLFQDTENLPTEEELVHVILESLKGNKNHLERVESIIELMKEDAQKEDILQSLKNLATQMQNEIVSMMDTLHSLKTSAR